MSLKKHLSVLFILSLFFQSCNEEDVPFFKVKASTQYNYGDTLLISSDIDFELMVNNIESNSKRVIIIDSAFYNIGENRLSYTYKVDGKKKTLNRKIFVYPDNNVEDLNYKIVKVFDHSEDVYTQGLEMYRGNIYETGGEYKKSKLIKYDIDNIKSKIEFRYSDDIFAEGLTVLNDNLYTLSYREHFIFKFNPEDLTLIDRKKTPIDFEGWGLTNNGEELILSDGSNNIYFLNPIDYSIKRIIQVYNRKGKITYLNELEYVEDYIFANIYAKEIITVIDPNSGVVIFNVNMSKIAKEHKRQGVLNGIAKLNNGNFLICGKHWDKMYEISIDKFNK